MPRRADPRLYDLGLRAGGVCCALLGAAVIAWLNRLIDVPQRHEATADELLLAVIGFSGISAGSALTILGKHIHDQIRVTSRWATHSPQAPSGDAEPMPAVTTPPARPAARPSSPAVLAA